MMKNIRMKVYEYGDTYNVEVLSASNSLITVHAPDINEGFMLMGHGLKTLPNVGDNGKIVFEKGGVMGGHWQYHSI